jgi:uncharacterized protein YlaI
MDPTEITANCPICGDVKLTGTDVRVTQYLDDEAASIYTFTCPKCHEEHAKPAPRGVRAALWTAYPRPEWTQEYLTPPPVSFDPRPQGPPLTLDDLIDLMMELEQL